MEYFLIGVHAVFGISGQVEIIFNGLRWIDVLRKNRISSKVLNSFISIGTRQIFTYGLQWLTLALLARRLSPIDFGVFSIILYFKLLMNVFSDVGLGASLVRSIDEPKEEDYSAIFSLQQIFVALFVVLYIVMFRVIVSKYGLPRSYNAIFYTIPIAYMIISLQTISIVKLERRLDFSLIAKIDIIESLIFNFILILGSFSRIMLAFFVVAILSRSIIYSTMAYKYTRWVPKLGWDLRKGMNHLRFGLAVQGINFLSIIKDGIGPFYIAAILGPQSFGRVNWAQVVSAFPAIAILIFQRLVFPILARLQRDTKLLNEYLKLMYLTSTFVVSFIAFPLLINIKMVVIAVFGVNWLSALPIFYWLWIANVINPLMLPIFQYNQAAGRAKENFFLALWWTIGTWGFGVIFMREFGVVGYGMAGCLVQLFNIPFIVIMWNRLKFVPVYEILLPWSLAWIPAVGMWFVGRILHNWSPQVAVGIMVILGAALTAALFQAFIWPHVTSIWSKIKEMELDSASMTVPED